MAKRIAVLVRERQSEALRVAIGLTLAGDRVDVVVLDRSVAEVPETRTYLGALKEIGVRVATNVPGNSGLEYLPNAEIARLIAGCDAIVPY
jgi:citrate lyase alpha subunit